MMRIMLVVRDICFHFTTSGICEYLNMACKPVSISTKNQSMNFILGCYVRISPVLRKDVSIVCPLRVAKTC